MVEPQGTLTRQVLGEEWNARGNEGPCTQTGSGSSRGKA